MSTFVAERAPRCCLCGCDISAVDRDNDSTTVKCKSPLFMALNDGDPVILVHAECLFSKLSQRATAGVDICRGGVDGIHTVVEAVPAKQQQAPLSFHEVFRSRDRCTATAMRLLSELDLRRKTSGDKDDVLPLEQALVYLMWECRLTDALTSDTAYLAHQPAWFVHRPSRLRSNCIWFDLQRTAMDTAMATIRNADETMEGLRDQASWGRYKVQLQQLLGVLTQFVRKRSFTEWSTAPMGMNDEDKYSPRACDTAIAYTRALTWYVTGRWTLRAYATDVMAGKMVTIARPKSKHERRAEMRDLIDEDDIHPDEEDDSNDAVDEKQDDPNNLRVHARQASLEFHTGYRLLQVASRSFAGVANACTEPLDTSCVAAAPRPKKSTDTPDKHAWAKQLRYMFLLVRAYSYMARGGETRRRALAFVHCAERNGAHVLMRDALIKDAATTRGSWIHDDLAVLIPRVYLKGSKLKGQMSIVGTDPLHAKRDYLARDTSAYYKAGVPVYEPTNERGVNFDVEDADNDDAEDLYG